jgi:excisionase family DNA binding protein
MQMLEHEPLTADEQRILEKLEQLLRAATSAELLIRSEGETVTLPIGLFQLLQQIVLHLEEGKMFFVLDGEQTLTTQEAANILHVSRPYLVKLLENGEIPFTKVGLHRRIRFQDVMNYLKKREEREEEGLQELARLSQEYGLYD